MAEVVTATAPGIRSRMPSTRRYRVLLVCSHPVQYMAPVLRRMAQHPQVDIQVAYCDLGGAEPALDPDFGREVMWDIPLLDGYEWLQVPNRAIRPGSGRFFGLVNPGLWKMVRGGNYDAVAVFTGYVCASFWIVLAAAKASGIPILFGTDAHELVSPDDRQWKLRVKKWLWPGLFRLADIVIVPSSGSVRLMRSLGIPSDRIALTPYSVDNEWWSQRSANADRSATRAAWNIPDSAAVVLFCAKLQPWKRPHDLLHAFARANVSDAYLVYAGEGRLRLDLEAETRSLGICDRVRFIGFVNQSRLPAVYSASDLLVLPSQHEPFGVVVNEAMLCGCATAVSDHVGARFDLIRHGQTGFIFPAGDVDALAAVLREALEDRDRLRQISEAARQQMKNWSPTQNIEAMVRAIELGTASHANRSTAALL